MLTWIGTLMIGCFLLGCIAVIVTSVFQILKSIVHIPMSRGLASKTQEA